MSKIYDFLAWIISILWALFVRTLQTFARIWKKREQGDISIKPGGPVYHNLPPSPMPLEPGEKIRDMIWKKHEEYMLSDKSNAERPIIELTVQQCFHLVSYTEVTSRYYNSIIALAGGEIVEFSYASVKVKIKKVPTCSK